MIKYMILLTLASFSLCVPGCIPAGGKGNIITYFNMTKVKDTRIRLVDGKWMYAHLPVKVTAIDSGHEYFEVDMGSGSKLSAVLFLEKNRGPVLVEIAEHHGFGECRDVHYYLRIYRLWKGKMMEAAGVLPGLPLKLFLRNGYDPFQSLLYLRNWEGYIGYRLKNSGYTMEAFLDMRSLSYQLEFYREQMKAKDYEMTREFIQNVRKEPLKLKWNMETGAFDPPYVQ